jgi:hypothetical protein
VLSSAHDYRYCLRKAAKAAGIDRLRAGRISDYNFRHSRLTHLGQVTDNVVGIMYIAGHTQLATTSRYVNPPKEAAYDAAAEVLRAAAGGKAGAPSPGASGADLSPFGGEVQNSRSTSPGQGQEGLRPEFWPHSGRGDSDDVRVELLPPESENPESLVVTRGSGSVRGGGIEPPWLLTASTSRARERANHWIVWESERQRTLGNGRKRPIPVAATGIRTGRYRVRARSRRRRMASPKGPRRASVRSAPSREGPWARTLNVIPTPRGTGSRRDRERGARIADPSGALISIPRTKGPSRRKQEVSTAA